jgi:hypothetical protein
MVNTCSTQFFNPQVSALNRSSDSPFHLFSNKHGFDPVSSSTSSYGNPPSYRQMNDPSSNALLPQTSTLEWGSCLLRLLVNDCMVLNQDQRDIVVSHYWTMSKFTQHLLSTQPRGLYIFCAFLLGYYAAAFSSTNEESARVQWTSARAIHLKMMRIFSHQQYPDLMHFRIDRDEILRTAMTAQRNLHNIFFLNNILQQAFEVAVEEGLLLFPPHFIS